MQWFSHIWSLSPFNQLAHLGFEQFNHWPDCEDLNRLAPLSKRFVAQDKLNDETDYYEQIIFKQHLIPTRLANWHDLFNAAIWLNFPLSKAELNHQHIEDINQSGLHPRTPRRNRITHFDECGVVLVYRDGLVPQLLREHQWQKAFVQHRDQWGSKVDALIFGHANYEMFLQPYIGLTGKFLALPVQDEFWQASPTQKYRLVDQALLDYLHTNPLADKGGLSPLPLLGVPGWWAENERSEFYQNKTYFMPKR